MPTEGMAPWFRQKLNVPTRSRGHSVASDDGSSGLFGATADMGQVPNGEGDWRRRRRIGLVACSEITMQIAAKYER